MAVVTAGGDGLGPAVQVVERLAGEGAQRGVHRRRHGQARVEQLFAGPGGFAVVLQPDHARAALERVEGAAHRRHLAQVLGLLRQPRHRGACVVDDLARLLDEDLAHLRVVFQPGLPRGRDTCRRHRRRRRQGLGRRRREGGHGLREFVAHGLARRGIGGLVERRLRTAHRPCQGRLLGSGGLARQALQFLGQHGVGHLRLHQGLRLVQQCRRLGHRQRCFVERGKGRGLLALPHHGAQAAGLGVVAEQRLGELRLHAQHVDQEAQRTQVVGQAVEGAGLHRTLRVDLGLRQRVDVVAHVQHGLRGLVHAQHRQHAAHRRQLARHRDQHLALGRVAEVLVDLLLDLGQRRAQLLHHAAHGLAVADAAVQLLHPGFQRLRLGAQAQVVDAARQPLHARGQLGVVEVAVLDGGVQVQHRGGDFHRQRRRRRGCGADGLCHRGLQRRGQHVARREQALQRITDQRELLGQPGQAVQFAAGHGRPGVLGAGHALLRLGDPGGVEATQPRGFVVDARRGVQAPGPAHRFQARARARRLRVGAEEQQVLRQPVGDVVQPLHRGAQLREQARRDALAVDVAGQQPVCLRLEEGRRQLPQRGQAAAAARARTVGLQCPRAEPGAKVAHVLVQMAVGVAHQRQHQGLHRAARVVVGGTRLRRGVGRNVVPGPVVLPQVGRMHAVGAGEQLHRAVLREQRHRRHRLAHEHAREVVEQRERGLLDGLDRAHVDDGGLGRHALHRGFAGAQHVRGRRQPDELQRTHALVDVHARRAQHRRIDGVDIGAAQRLGFLQVAPQRLVRRLQRLAQFAMHPGQRAEVVVHCCVVHRDHRSVHQPSRRRGSGSAGPPAAPPWGGAPQALRGGAITPP